MKKTDTVVEKAEAPYLKRYNMFRGQNCETENKISFSLLCFALDSRRIFGALEYTDRRDGFRTPKKAKKKPIPKVNKRLDEFVSEWNTKDERSGPKTGSCSISEVKVKIGNKYGSLNTVDNSENRKKH